MYDIIPFDDAYHHSLRQLYFQWQKADVTHPDKEAVNLARELIHQAVRFDQNRVTKLLQQKFDGKIERNFDQPETYTSSFVIGQSWSDHLDQPLDQEEQWNHDRRATNNGMKYKLDEDGYPINPYCDYGVKGRGMIGLYGPNHAVDDGVLRIMANADGKLSLHALGIIRNDSGLPALCGGFTNFVKYGDGIYPYNDQVKIDTQAHEFFEEMVSGSVTLLPEYAEGLENEIACHIQAREITEGHELSEYYCKMIAAETTTHRKVQQVQKEDPLFFSRLRQAFREATPCYEGPVMSSSRNTNTSWMETKLSYFIMDEAKWEEIKGDNKFDYKLIAGDDAGQAMWHEITPELIQNAESHGAFFTYLLSAYLLNETQNNPEILAAVKDQARDLLAFFKEEPAPTPLWAVKKHLVSTGPQ